MSNKHNKEVVGTAVVVKVLDAEVLEKSGQRRIIKDYIAPSCFNEVGLAEFVKGTVKAYAGTAVKLEFEYYIAVLKVGRRKDPPAAKVLFPPKESSDAPSA